MNNELREYGRNIKAIKDILSGKKTSLIKNLEKEMKDLSDKQEFEKARELQYKIEKLKRVFQNAQIIATGSKQQAVSKILSSLKDSLRLDKLPRRIECYDIANIQGRHAVGAMVVFTDDQPDKNEYRKFKIYSKNTADDTAMLKEVLIRRFNHPEWQYPDLIIVDGGKGQLNTALAVLRESRISNLESRIRLVALTKNEKHIGHKVILTNGKETRPNVPRQNDIHVGLTFGTGEVLLSKLPVPVKNLLLQIDGEAHRFAINYYRKLHSKSLK